jgi:uncharacterized protein YwgA
MIGGALNTSRGILDLIATSGGSVDTRIRLQKMAFLAKLLGADVFGGLKFSYHHYGPYCRELSDALRDLVSFGLLSEEVSDVAESKKYSYRVTMSGRSWLDRVGSGSAILNTVANVSKGHNWRTLELASTIAFVERRDRSSRENALARSLELKPKCAAFRSDALSLLNQLAL